MFDLERIRKSKYAKWTIYIFIGLLVYVFVDSLLRSYYSYESIKSQDRTNDIIKEQVNKMQDDELFYYKIDSLANANQYQKAIELTKLRIKKYPEDKVYLTRYIGNIYYHKMDIDSAIIQYTKAISLLDGYVNAYVDRGWAYLDIDSIDLAIIDFDYAAGKNWDFYFELGYAQELKGMLEDAIDSYDEYLKHYPDKKECIIRRDSIKDIINNGLQ